MAGAWNTGRLVTHPALRPALSLRGRAPLRAPPALGNQGSARDGNDRTERRGRPSKSVLATDVARPCTIE